MTVDRRPDPAPDAIGRVNEWSGPVPRMRDLTHVHGDHDPRAWHWFTRGPVIAADGGRHEVADPDDRPRRNVEDEQLRDVSHQPADGPDANRVWERGDESEADTDEETE